MLSELE
jgi:serine/threonine protein kinase